MIKCDGFLIVNVLFFVIFQPPEWYFGAREGLCVYPSRWQSLTFQIILLDWKYNYLDIQIKNILICE